LQANLTKNLRASRLVEANNVLRLLDDGASIDIEEGLQADPVGLLETYQARSKHLAQFSSRHAKRLQRTTNEFCEHLSRQADQSVIGHARIDDDLLGSYILWFLVKQEIPLGCLYVIGKSEVPDDVWETIWND